MRISERINATTSSMTAAPNRAVPSLVLRISSPIVGAANRVSTVPSDVDERAEPAANAWRRGNENMGVKRNERAMGVRRPVSAIPVERGKRAVKVDNEVVQPPRMGRSAC